MSDEKILTALATLERTVAALGAEVGTMRSELGTMHSEVGTMHSEVGTMHSEVGTLRSELGTMRSEFGTLHSEFSTLRSELTKFRVETMARFDRMEERFTQTRDDMSVNMAAVETVRNGHENIRGELNSIHEIIAILTRKQRRLEAQVDDLTKPPDFT